MKAKQVIRCTSNAHGERLGNIVCALSDNAIFVKCKERDCSRWTKITISIPGIRLDLSSAGIVQETLPEGYHLHLEPAVTVVGSR